MAENKHVVTAEEFVSLCCAKIAEFEESPVTPVNEFYKKGCQEKSSASAGGDFFLERSSPL